MRKVFVRKRIPQREAVVESVLSVSGVCPDTALGLREEHPDH